MIIANRPLNRQAITLEEAEAQIRLTVKNEYLSKTPKFIVDRKIKKIISDTAKQIKIPALREVGIKSLIAFYNAQWRTIQMLGDPVILLLLNNLTDKTRAEIDKEKDIKKLQDKGVLSEYESQARLLGVPLREYADKYMKDRVQPVMKRLAELQPLDPDRDDRKVSLRARAEMEVRYQSHVDEIDNLKQDGVKLVICSVHADCSERCAPWQGKVYSLDGTTGTTDDGRKYVPLEVATQRNFTKHGVPNGLLGFNCRHYLIPYKSGFSFPKPNAAEERKEYAITLRQRQLERNVLTWRTKALESATKEEYQKAKQKAKFWNSVYIKYSRDNERAYYPSRTKIL